ncbi:MAG: filamentation induced by cAMP protein Fic [uncultured bacterium]|nr:MAG: filamentation induced by cAMP protein Fic [uncultured bacterium]
MVLARSDNQNNRYYSMSTQIKNERKKYYEILESTQKKNLDITPWLEWFLGCLHRAINQSEIILKNVLNKSAFWKQHTAKSFNQRQIIMLNILFDGFKGKLTSSKWAKMTKCSQDTAARDIHQLIENNILVRSAEGGRSTHYVLKEYPINYIE